MVEDVPHPKEVPHTFETSVTLETVIEAHTLHTADDVPHADDVEVTPPVERHTNDVIAIASTDPFCTHCDGFPGGPIDTSILIGYATFRFW